MRLGAQWSHLANMTEPFMFGGDAALCQITLTTYYYITTNFNYLKVNAFSTAIFYIRIE